MTKAFDKSWHQVLIFKLKSNWGFRFSMKLYIFISLIESLVAGAQDSILGSLFFVIYIDNLTDDLVSTVKLFADDTSLFYVVHFSNI